MRGQLVKKALAESLEELLKKKTIDEITVNDIIERVGISRTTFYRHFADKYELINWVYGQYMEELERKHTKNTDFRQIMVELFKFFYLKRIFFSKIMYYTGQNSFYSYFFSRTSEYLAAQFFDSMNLKEIMAADKYMLSYHCGGILRVAYEWIEDGCRQKPEELADILLEIVNGEHRAYALPFFREVSGNSRKS